MKQIENRIVNDSVWENLEKESMYRLKSPGYEEIGTGIFVPEESAYDYALERIASDDELKQEFVEWFYSGNWIKEGLGETWR